jgi:methyl-accepting chemotaxis protein
VAQVEHTAADSASKSKETDLERRRRYLLISEVDLQRLVAVRDVAAKHAAAVVDRFYEHLLSNPETKAHFRSEKHIRNVKRTQAQYFAELFLGNCDEAYLEDRLRVGKTHERIGLAPEWYIGAYCIYMNQLLPIIMHQFKDDIDLGIATFQSLVKLICFDVAVAIDTYIEAMATREADQVRSFVDAITEFSTDLATASSGILGATANQTSAAQQQAAGIAEITTTLSELRQMSGQVLEKAEKVISESDRSIEASKTGAKAVEDAIQGMHEVREQVETIAQKIVSLSEQTQQIGDIITSVNEIAEQSKLLALNAAIEAARAGDHGRGFAVVATEIRSLAEQSKQATGRVRKILGDIQAATNSAVVATEQGTKKVESGVNLANRAGENIHVLGQSVEESAGAARLIANAARQQSAGIQQVADAMGSINQATVSTVAGLKQTEDSAQKLDHMTNSMNALVATFTKPKVKQAEYKMA